MTPIASFPTPAAAPDTAPPDDRSMLLLERAMALVALVAVAVLAVAR